MQQAILEMRKRVTVKEGDILLFEPHIEALAGESAAFFRKYAGQTATVLGFEEDGMSTFGRMLAAMAETKEPKKVVGRFFVEFENGDRPTHSVAAIHFVVE